MRIYNFPIVEADQVTVYQPIDLDYIVSIGPSTSFDMGTEWRDGAEFKIFIKIGMPIDVYAIVSTAIYLDGDRPKLNIHERPALKSLAVERDKLIQAWAQGEKVEDVSQHLGTTPAKEPVPYGALRSRMDEVTEALGYSGRSTRDREKLFKGAWAKLKDLLLDERGEPAYGPIGSSVYGQESYDRLLELAIHMRRYDGFMESGNKKSARVSLDEIRSILSPYPPTRVFRSTSPT